jgi:hypothetical protein
MPVSRYATAWWVVEGRARDGCPWRRPGHALLQITLVPLSMAPFGSWVFLKSFRVEASWWHGGYRDQ